MTVYTSMNAIDWSVDNWSIILLLDYPQNSCQPKLTRNPSHPLLPYAGHSAGELLSLHFRRSGAVGGGQGLAMVEGSRIATEQLRPAPGKLPAAYGEDT